MQCKNDKHIEVKWGKLHNFPFFSVHIVQNKESISVYKKVSVLELQNSAENWSLREFSLRSESIDYGVIKSPDVNT